MARREGLGALRKQLQDAGAPKKELTDDRIEYRVILGTLTRMKQKDKVPASRNSEVYAYDQDVERRLPVNRGEDVDRNNPPKAPYACRDYESGKDCETCFTQYFPVRIRVSDAEALQKVLVLSTSIFADLAFLRQVVTRHADAIVNRWRKKSSQKREHVLVGLRSKHGTEDDHELNNTYPPGTTLYDKKWAAIHLINDRSSDAAETPPPPGVVKDLRDAVLFPVVMGGLQSMVLEDQTTRYQTSFLLPYLDIETLAEEPLLFLALLYYRTAHEPEEWMMFDNSQLKLAENFEVMIGEFNAHCVNMTGAHYGAELVNYDKDKCHSWEIMGYQKAVYILTAQQHMMQFLRRTTQALLDEAKIELSGHYEEAKILSSKWDQLIQNRFYSFGTASAQGSSTFANQPFSAPSRFDPIATLELVKSLYQESEDELYLAQTDPAYLQHLIQELNATLYFEHVDKTSKWDWFVDEIALNFYRRYVWWRQMLRECEYLAEVFRTYQHDPTAANCQAYRDAVLAVQNLAIEHLTQQILLMKYTLPFQRGFERNYQWAQHVEKTGKKKPTINHRDYFNDDKLFWAMKCMGFDEHGNFNMDPSFHFRVIDDYLSDANHKERHRISASLRRSVSEMAAVEGIRTSIECDREFGGNQRMELNHTPYNPKFRSDFISQYQRKLHPTAIMHSTRISTHLQTFCQETPWSKGRMDASWLQRAADCRQNLNQVWRTLRDALKTQQVNKSFSQYLIDEDFAILSAADQPETAKAIEQERLFVLAKVRQQKQPRDLEVETDLRRSDDTQVTEKFTAPVIKKKQKRRPSTSESESLSETSSTEALSSSSIGTNSVVVQKENLNLFVHMLAAGQEQIRSYSWTHFLQAMVDAGFSVTHRGGSAVSFKSENGVIAFHRPHPEPTINPIMLVSMGKRLKKWFGWEAATFTTRTRQEA